MRKFSFSALWVAGLLLCSALSANAETFVAVAKQSKIFDEPNVKGYVSLNTRNQEITPERGMVFKSMEHNNGWHIVEYSPGIRGYLSDQAVSSPSRLPNPGTYNLANHQGVSLKVTLSGDKWEAEANGKTYPGIAQGNILIFTNSGNVPVFSVVDFGDGPIAMSYDNDVTGFF